jgi:hypothetical protein
VLLNLVQHMMIDLKHDQVQLKSITFYSIMMVDLTSSLMLVVIGFVTTFGAMEAAWRMGKMIGKRGEKQSCGGRPKMMLCDLA